MLSNIIGRQLPVSFDAPVAGVASSISPTRLAQIGVIARRALITAVFEASNAALDSFTQLVPEIDRDQVEYALATLLLEEAWVAER